MPAILSFAARLRELQQQGPNLFVRRAVVALAVATLVGCGGAGEGAGSAEAFDPQAAGAGAGALSAVNLVVDTNSPSFKATEAQRLATVTSAGTAGRLVSSGSATTKASTRGRTSNSIGESPKV